MGGRQDRDTTIEKPTESGRLTRQPRQRITRRLDLERPELVRNGDQVCPLVGIRNPELLYEDRSPTGRCRRDRRQPIEYGLRGSFHGQAVRILSVTTREYATL